MTVRGAAVPLTPRTAAVLLVASVTGVLMICWPLFLTVEQSQRVDPPFFFLALLPVILAVVLAEMSEGGMDARVLAILGVLSAINAVLRGYYEHERGKEPQR
jgi:energy-coupling factor transport system substrate-specific component